jgi:hypothetical protein
MSAPQSSDEASQPSTTPPDLPRRPGTWPTDFPDCRLNFRFIPVPGQKLPPEFDVPIRASMGRSVRLVVAENAAPIVPVSRAGTLGSGEPPRKGPDPKRITIDRKATQRGQRIPLLALNPSYADFPTLTVALPKFKSQAKQYPSGNITGTETFRPFEAHLRVLLTTV